MRDDANLSGVEEEKGKNCKLFTKIDDHNELFQLALSQLNLKVYIEPAISILSAFTP